MGKVVRAFSIDPHVSKSLDHRVRKRRRSEYVNEALDWYMNKNLREYQKEVISARNFMIAEINKKRVIIGGLEDDLETFYISMGRLKEHCGELEARIKSHSECRCLWCRLKKRLQRSQVE